MSAKGEIGWKRRDEEGQRVKICAEPAGDKWRFYQQYKRFEKWELVEHTPLEDWLELLDAVRRRISRKKIAEGEDAKLIRMIKQHFPEAEL